jgi:Ca-activated chloride channel homolog
MRFGAPAFLPLLAIPAALLILWTWQLWKRRADARAFMRRRQVPVHERVPYFGELLFWLFLIFAAGAALLALAKPQAVTSLVRTAGVDIVILQDGSASMHVTDVRPNRWQRSMRFLRTFGEALRWENDRIAMALFAHVATPQIRLTKDPNTYFFYLDHLDEMSPFRLEDDGTWDTNIERGIYWGLRLIDKDAELRKTSGLIEKAGGVASNAKSFVLVTDGQSWSGEVATSLALAQERGVPLNVVGVGTTAGGLIPDPKRAPDQPALRSVLNRAELGRVATAGGGRYFELEGGQNDREIANAIIDSTRRRAGTVGIQEGTQELYWNFLLAAAVFLAVGVLFLRDRVALALQLGAAAAVMLFVTTVF